MGLARHGAAKGKGHHNEGRGGLTVGRTPRQIFHQCSAVVAPSCARSCAAGCYPPSLPLPLRTGADCRRAWLHGGLALHVHKAWILSTWPGPRLQGCAHATTSRDSRGAAAQPRQGAARGTGAASQPRRGGAWRGCSWRVRGANLSRTCRRRRLTQATCAAPSQPATNSAPRRQERSHGVRAEKSKVPQRRMGHRGASVTATWTGFSSSSSPSVPTPDGVTTRDVA